MDINLILEEIVDNHNKYKNGEIVDARNDQHYSYKLLREVISKSKKYSDSYFIAGYEEKRKKELLNRLNDKKTEEHLIKEREILVEKKKEYSRLLYEYILQSIFILLYELENIDDEDIETYDCPKKFQAMCATFDDIQNV